MGGQGILIDALNIPRNWQHTLHIIVKTAVLIKGISHAIIALSLNPKPKQIITSGWAVSSTDKFS